MPGPDQPGLDFGVPAPAWRPPETEADRLSWLRLARSETVGPITFQRLLTRYGAIAKAIEAAPALASKSGGKPLILQGYDQTAAEMEAGRALGARLICLGEPGYPALLAQIDAPPPLLWVLGDPGLLSGPSLAVVGARNASALGRRFAESLSRELADQGLAIISGLARGVDTAAHDGALAAGPQGGGAAAVLAGGVDHIYPPENKALHQRLAAEGALISEMPIGFQPQAKHFPRRNRIVSGLSLGVLVVEAAERSGSLITARLAGEQGREVMAVPGHPWDARAAGCNALLRQGAALIRSAADVIEALGAAPVSMARAPRQKHDSATQKTRLRSVNASQFRATSAPPVTAAASPPQPMDNGMTGSPAGSESSLPDVLFDRLSAAPVDVDLVLRGLTQDLGVSAPDAAAALLELELSGRVERRPGAQICRTAGKG